MKVNYGDLKVRLTNAGWRALKAVDADPDLKGGDMLRIIDAMWLEIQDAGFVVVERVAQANPDAPVLHHFTVIPDEDSFVITFPDLPGCLSQAENLYEIGPMAQDAYVNWTEATKEMAQAIPADSYEVPS